MRYVHGITKVYVIARSSEKFNQATQFWNEKHGFGDVEKEPNYYHVIWAISRWSRRSQMNVLENWIDWTC
jgi:hypothetical protein